MKNNIIIALIITALIFRQTYIFADGESENFGHLKITSYCKSLNFGLDEIYNELISNFCSEELEYLSDIYIYPDSSKGVNGYYFDDIRVGKDGYEKGRNARIEIYNADRYSAIEDMAYVISHEYGHHYMTYNILDAENKYIPKWSETRYAKIRQLDKYAVIYDNNNADVHTYDVSEIMADDYVQLLGSENARKFVEFDEDSAQNSYFKDIFNLKPQKNSELPLASEVDGLYSYFLEIGGFTGTKSEPSALPKINGISITEDVCTVEYEKPEGDYRFTLVMYPSGNPFTPIPLKTQDSGEDSFSVDMKGKYFEGEYTFIIYLSDRNNYIYSSDKYNYIFGNEYSEITTESTTAELYTDNHGHREESEKGKNDENKKILRFTDAVRISYYKRVIYI